MNDSLSTLNELAKSRYDFKVFGKKAKEYKEIFNNVLGYFKEDGKSSRSLRKISDKMYKTMLKNSKCDFYSLVRELTE